MIFEQKMRTDNLCETKYLLLLHSQTPNDGGIAQLVRRMIHNHEVRGSSPRPATIKGYDFRHNLFRLST